MYFKARFSQQTMDSLLEAGLIEARGRKETAGRRSGQ